MAKKKRSEPTTIEPFVPTVDPIELEFDKAKGRSQIDRHERIGKLFDKATDVLSQYLDDPDVGPAEKMFPAKLITDIYVADEKFKREDARIEIESRKLTIEEAKLPQSTNIAIQQNNYINESKVNLTELKKKQEELLSNFLPKEPIKNELDDDQVDK
jgi:hypothetical protein